MGMQEPSASGIKLIIKELESSVFDEIVLNECSTPAVSLVSMLFLLPEHI